MTTIYIVERYFRLTVGTACFEGLATLLFERKLSLGFGTRLEGDIPSSIDIEYDIFLLGRLSLSMQHQLMVLLLSPSAIVHDELL